MIRLMDLCSKIGSGATPKGGKNAYLGGEYALIRSQNVLHNDFSNEGLAFIDDDQTKNLENVSVEEDDVLLNITGDSVARCCNVPKEVLPARVNQHVMIIRTNSNELCPYYLKYYLISRQLQSFLLTLASAGATRNALTKSMIENLEIKNLDITVQKSISSFLRKFDKKIQKNKKENETLEEIAKTLFKSWFIDFDPVRAKAEGRPTGLSKEISDLFPDSYEGSELGEIPKGWKASQVKDFCSVIQKGIAPKYTENQSYPVINQKCIRNLEINFDLCRFTEYKKVMEDRYLENFDILLNSMGTGTLGRSALFVEHHTKAVVDGCISVMRGKSKNFSLYVYQSISRREDEIINLSQGSTGQTTLKTEDIGNLNLIQPTNELIELFGKSVIDLHLKKYSNSQENKVLSNLRDTLLPKLISGELKISDTENLIKEAGI